LIDLAPGKQRERKKKQLRKKNRRKEGILESSTHNEDEKSVDPVSGILAFMPFLEKKANLKPRSLS